MNNSISSNTQAILLLTAPLIAGHGAYSTELLTPSEYNKVAKLLRDTEREPSDLLGPEAGELLQEVQSVVDPGRLRRLLGRGFLLSQAVERWQTRAIWVISRADHDYPKRMKERLREAAPAILYGCGDTTILETGGLAIVGSRHVDEALTDYTESVGSLAARAEKTVVSGAARGIDQAAMHGALQRGGHVAGVLADGLERLALARELREYLMDDRLVLVSPYDPAAGFDVGHAMQRNKVIYALADAALVVSSDYGKGGTWTGAVEQLEKLHFVPVYVRSDGIPQRGLQALQEKGALPWPNPSSPEMLVEALRTQVALVKSTSEPLQLALSIRDEPAKIAEPNAGLYAPCTPAPISGQTPPNATAADQLFAKAKDLLLQMQTPITEAAVAAHLRISTGQARQWLHRLVQEGSLERKEAGFTKLEVNDR